MNKRNPKRALALLKSRSFAHTNCYGIGVGRTRKIMAIKLKNGLYSVQMYLSESEYLEWQANQTEAGLSESSYCRVMNLLPVRTAGAKAANQNRKKGIAKQKELARDNQKIEARRNDLRRRYAVALDEADEN